MAPNSADNISGAQSVPNVMNQLFGYMVISYVKKKIGVVDDYYEKLLVHHSDVNGPPPPRPILTPSPRRILLPPPTGPSPRRLLRAQFLRRTLLVILISAYTIPLYYKPFFHFIINDKEKKG